MIPHEELAALAQIPPEQRGTHVRVIQGFDSSDQPPSAPAVGTTTVVVVPPVPAPVAGTAAGAKEQSKWWLVVAAVVAIAFAASEGSRWDGWVAMHPMQPVHLYGPRGEYSWVPLAQLDAQTAAWAQKAYVREEEGPAWRFLERAPLDRVGFTYSLLLGAGSLVSEDGSTPYGFLSHIELGFAPIQNLVFLADFGLGWADNSQSNTLFESRSGLQVQAYLPPFRPLHLGLYGTIGLGFRDEDYPPYTDSGATLYYAGGGIVQLELTTRLALTVRGGATHLYHAWGSEISIGVSIY